MEMFPERAAAWRSVGISGGSTRASLFISSARLLQPAAATQRTCVDTRGTFHWSGPGWA